MIRAFWVSVNFLPCISSPQIVEDVRNTSILLVQEQARSLRYRYTKNNPRLCARTQWHDRGLLYKPTYADGETRTRKDCSTRPSSVRVYQFHHIRVVFDEQRF